MRLTVLMRLYSAATRLASVAYFVRGMLGILLHADGARIEIGEWWYGEPFAAWGEC